MKFPEREQVHEIGSKVQKAGAYEPREIDLMINRVLGLVDTI